MQCGFKTIQQLVSFGSAISLSRAKPVCLGDRQEQGRHIEAMGA